MYTLEVERIIDAPVDVIWEVISDVERYAEYAPNLSKAIKTGEGTTPGRRCWDTQGRSWDEACVLWDEGHEYSYIIDTTSYPYPFIQMKGTWGLEEMTDGIRVYMCFNYTPSQSLLLGWISHQVARRAFAPVIDELFNNWETEISRRVSQIVA